MNKVIIKLYKLKWGYSIVLLYLIGYTPSLLFLLMSTLFSDLSDPSRSQAYELGLPILLICGVLIGPFAETFLCQYLPFAISGDWHKKKIILLSILSGVFFGLLHVGNFPLFIIKAACGFFYQFWFILFARKYNSTVAFLSVSGAHLLNNLIAVLTAHFTGII